MAFVRKRDEQIAAAEMELVVADAIGLPAAFEITDFHHLSVAMRFQRRVRVCILVPAQHHHVTKAQRSKVQDPAFLRRIDRNRRKV
jgi:hypothetical protein